MDRISLRTSRLPLRNDLMTLEPRAAH